MNADRGRPRFAVDEPRRGAAQASSSAAKPSSVRQTRLRSARHTASGVGLVPHRRARPQQPVSRQGAARARQAPWPRRRFDGHRARRTLRAAARSCGRDAAPLRARDAARHRCARSSPRSTGTGNDLARAAHRACRLQLQRRRAGERRCQPHEPHAAPALAPCDRGADRGFGRFRRAHPARRCALHRARQAPGHLRAGLPAALSPVPAAASRRSCIRATWRRLEAVVPAWAAGVPVRIHGEHGWSAEDPDGAQAPLPVCAACCTGPSSSAMWRCPAISPLTSSAASACRATRISQIYNGVDTERLHTASARATAISGCPFGDPDEWLVGSVGRMDPVKDPLDLARAPSPCAQSCRPAAARAPAAGDRRRRPAAQKRSTLHSIVRARREHVWFAGERADVPDIMRGLDCFVLPSLAEGISNTILEAMATAFRWSLPRVGGNARADRARA